MPPPRPSARLRPSAAPPPSRLKIVLALAVAALALSGCDAAFSLYPPTPVTEQGRDIHDLYNIVFLFAAAIFVAVEGAIVYIVLRYRRRDEHDELLPEQIHGHTGVEVLWTVIPFVIVAFLFFVSWQALGRVVADTSQSAGVYVKVTGFQWCWSFEYVDEGLTVQPPTNSPSENCRDEEGDPPTLVVPVGERIRLQLHSPDVIHAFYVPQFLSKLDVIPHRDEQLDNIFDFTPTEIGEFRGQCAEFCGLLHSEMQLAVSVRSQADYEAWLAAEKTRPSPTPAGSPPAGSPPPGSPPPGPATLEVSATTAISFEQNQLVAPADTPFVIHFDNKQVAVPHNVWIRDASGQDVFQGPDVQGPGSTDYQVGPLAAGTYTFYCQIHPNMTGTLEVQ